MYLGTEQQAFPSPKIHIYTLISDTGIGRVPPYIKRQIAAGNIHIETHMVPMKPAWEPTPATRQISRPP